MKKIKIIFVGTSAIGVRLLESLSRDERFQVMMVVTTPDKPAGRKLETTASPVKMAAEKLGLPLFQPKDINSGESLETLEGVGADMILLVAFGQILKNELLNLTPYGCLNVHASLLPKYRGASPIQSALLSQEKATGITLMKMVEKMDAGPVYATFRMEISESDDQESLTKKLGELAAEQVPSALVDLFETNLMPREQDESKASYCRKIKKEDGLLDWNDIVYNLEAKVRALAGWPGSYTFYDGKRIKILKAKAHEKPVSETPGTVTNEGVACQNGLLEIIELQPEGKNRQSLEDFLNGHPDFIGSVLGS